MRVRREEHHALRDVLPDDVKAEAVRLNVASRERGGESVITPARVRELGEKDVRRLVSESRGDPQRASLLIEQRMAERSQERHRER
jgi:hypothetical protein